MYTYIYIYIYIYHIYIYIYYLKGGPQDCLKHDDYRSGNPVCGPLNPNMGVHYRGVQWEGGCSGLG